MSDTVAQPVSTAFEEAYPARLDARLDEPLNRWLWLVKWFLAIPHWIILALLWIAFVLTSIAAWFAIVFTGRYPRGIFDFNLGVMRWSWRVGYYATTGIGTDRYPPFSLGPEPDYPATLDVDYPEQLSHWKPFLKWLLLFPQWFIVAAFAGGWGGWHSAPGWPGAIDALTLVVGMILLVKQRYPRNLQVLIVGMSRWVFRVGVYLALMRDEYPPFRLEP